jgi:hypothetical protein
MSIIKPKVTVDTNTDLGYDLIADPTKIKVQKKNISLTNISETEDDGDSHVVDKLSDKSGSESRKSSKSSKSSRSSRTDTSLSKSSRSPTPKNITLSKPIALPAAPVYPPKPTNFFANFFGGSNPKPQEAAPAAGAGTASAQPNYSFPSNQPKDNYDSLPEDQKRLKRLQKFAELKYIKDTYKVILTKEFSYNSDYHEMCAEIEFHRANISKKNSVEFLKSMVFGSVGMVDKLNKMFDPFGLKDSLDGFPEHLKMTTNDSEIYEELADKYKSRFKEYSVEMRFLLLIVGSAAGFVAAKKASESIPFFNNLDPKTKEDLVRNLSQNVQNNIVPSSAAQKAKEEQNRILQFMMQQKQQEEEKSARMSNILKQNDEQQRIIESIAKAKKQDDFNKSLLITSSIDSDDSTIQPSNRA